MSLELSQAEIQIAVYFSSTIPIPAGVPVTINHMGYNHAVANETVIPVNLVCNTFYFPFLNFNYCRYVTPYTYYVRCVQKTSSSFGAAVLTAAV